MKKSLRIQKNEDFQKVFKKGKSFANKQFVIYCLEKKDQPDFRIGLSVGKKLGNAVARNRVKRYIRQSLLEVKDEMKRGYDYVIIARTTAASLDFHETKKNLEHVLKIARVLPKQINQQK